MNTILISGRADAYTGNGNIFNYDVTIWGNLKGESIQFITNKVIQATCYGELWTIAKNIVSTYFKNEQLKDGAYTQYLDHINLY